MANCLFSDKQVQQIALEAIPGLTRVLTDYSGERDELDLFMQTEKATNVISLSPQDLTLSWNDLLQLIRDRSPKDWQPPPAELPIARDTQFVDELSGG